MDKTVSCRNCGWVHFEVSREFAEDAVKKFNTYFHTLTTKEQEDYYGGVETTIKHYDRCNHCGGSYSNFRDSKDGDCPSGSTIGPIINRDE